MSHELRVDRLIASEKIVRRGLAFGKVPFYQARDEFAGELGVTKETASDYVDFLKYWLPHDGYHFVPGSPRAFADALKSLASSGVSIAEGSQ